MALACTGTENSKGEYPPDGSANVITRPGAENGAGEPRKGPSGKAEKVTKGQTLPGSKFKSLTAL